MVAVAARIEAFERPLPPMPTPIYAPPSSELPPAAPSVAANDTRDTRTVSAFEADGRVTRVPLGSSRIIRGWVHGNEDGRS